MDFNLFIMELENNFSTYDPGDEAEAKLEQLHMQENHQGWWWCSGNIMSSIM